ncbi:hypothetical protein BC833DRAFT_618268 [Globomyces pollinis-pini]|nr:hypothetical protein BC833DRAFT_618268 [Globomyces pollinis-pini]
MALDNITLLIFPVLSLYGAFWLFQRCFVERILANALGVILFNTAFVAILQSILQLKYADNFQFKPSPPIYRPFDPTIPFDKTTFLADTWLSISSISWDFALAFHVFFIFVLHGLVSKVARYRYLSYISYITPFFFFYLPLAAFKIEEDPLTCEFIDGYIDRCTKARSIVILVLMAGSFACYYAVISILWPSVRKDKDSILPFQIDSFLLKLLLGFVLVSFLTWTPPIVYHLGARLPGHWDYAYRYFNYAIYSRGYFHALVFQNALSQPMEIGESRMKRFCLSMLLLLPTQPKEKIITTGDNYSVPNLNWDFSFNIEPTTSISMQSRSFSLERSNHRPVFIPFEEPRLSLSRNV